MVVCDVDSNVTAHLFSVCEQMIKKISVQNYVSSKRVLKSAELLQRNGGAGLLCKVQQGRLLSLCTCHVLNSSFR